MVQVHSKVWLGYRNRVQVLDPRLMCVEASFDAHPRKESQVDIDLLTGSNVDPKLFVFCPDPNF
jgi:hypothetical protein